MTVSGDVLRKKMDAAAARRGAKGGGDSGGGPGPAIGRILTEHFQIKTNASCEPFLGGALGALAGTGGKGRLAVFYRTAEKHEFLFWLDPLFVLMTAAWEHEGALPEIDASEEIKISAIDRKLAESLAKRILLALTTQNAGSTVELNPDALEPVDMGVDATRFVFEDETVPSLQFSFTASNINGVDLAGMTVVMPQHVLSNEFADETGDHDAQLLPWRRKLLARVAQAETVTRAYIAKQEMDLSRLANLEVGDTITLGEASLDLVGLESPEVDVCLPVEGGMRDLNGMRALHVRSASGAARSPSAQKNPVGGMMSNLEKEFGAR